MLLNVFIVFATIFVGKTLGLYENVPYITSLRQRDFEKTVVESSDVWVVEFYAKYCGHCQDYAKKYKAIAKALKPYVRFAAINGIVEKNVANKYNIDEFPTLLLFSVNKDKPRKLNLTQSAVVEAAAKGIEEKALAYLQPRFVRNLKVVELDDTSFPERVLCVEKPWFVYFYNSAYKNFSEHAKVLRKLSNVLKGKAKVGAFNLDNNQLFKGEQVGLRYFPYDRKSTNKFDVYDGNFTSEEIADFADGKQISERMEPHVYQVINEGIVRDTCEGKDLCIMAFLPSLEKCENECRADLINLLANMSVLYSEEDWGWLWSEGEKQTEIEAIFEIADEEYPILLAIDVSSKRFFKYNSTMDENNLKLFFDGIKDGTGAAMEITAEHYPSVEFAHFWCEGTQVLNEEKTVEHDEL